MAFFDEIVKWGHKIDPLTSKAIDLAHKSSSGLVRETSRGIKNVFGQDSAIGGLAAHWQDMSDKDYHDEGRWLKNTAIGVGSVLGAMYGAGAIEGAGSSSSAEYIGVGSSSGSGAGAGFSSGSSGGTGILDWLRYGNTARSLLGGSSGSSGSPTETSTSSSATPIAAGGAVSFLGSLFSGGAGGMMGPLGTMFGNLFTGGGTSTAQTAATMNDPFGSQRGQYQQQLAALYANPSSVQQMPGFQTEYNLALDATQRQMAAAGNTNSTLAMNTMAQVGPQIQQSYFNNMAQQLSYLAGAGIAPENPGGIYAQYMQPTNEAYGNIFSQFFQGLMGPNQSPANWGQNLAGLFGGGSGGTNLFSDTSSTPGMYYSGMDWGSAGADFFGMGGSPY